MNGTLSLSSSLRLPTAAADAVVQAPRWSGINDRRMHRRARCGSVSHREKRWAGNRGQETGANEEKKKRKKTTRPFDGNECAGLASPPSLVRPTPDHAEARNGGVPQRALCLQHSSRSLSPARGGSEERESESRSVFRMPRLSSLRCFSACLPRPFPRHAYAHVLRAVCRRHAGVRGRAGEKRLLPRAAERGHGLRFHSS